MSKDPNDKPLIQFNDDGFVLNYSVTRNEEIAFINYKDGTITFKQMPIPVERLYEMVDYYKNTESDHHKFLQRAKKEKINESADSKVNK